MATIWERVKQPLTWVAIGMAYSVGVGIGLGGLYLLVRLGYTYEWTGFGPTTRPVSVDPTQEFVPAKTLWDWLGLLIIPIVLAGGGIIFTWLDRQNDRRIAQDRIDEERRIAEENTQQATLQAYLEQMSGLLIDKGLGKSEVESEIISVTRAWTLTILRRLDGERKGLLLRFLYESDLILREPNVISLDGADLARADLVNAFLMKANLMKANLVKANIVEANLADANLKEAHMEKANLMEAYLADAHLEFAYLADSHLVGASLINAILIGADLKGANLENADLRGANLERTKLRGANLKNANLVDAYLENADFGEAKYNTETNWPEGFDPIAAGAILEE